MSSTSTKSRSRVKKTSNTEVATKNTTTSSRKKTTSVSKYSTTSDKVSKSVTSRHRKNSKKKIFESDDDDENDNVSEKEDDEQEEKVEDRKTNQIKVVSQSKKIPIVSSPISSSSEADESSSISSSESDYEEDDKGRVINTNSNNKIKKQRIIAIHANTSSSSTTTSSSNIPIQNSLDYKLSEIMSSVQDSYHTHHSACIQMEFLLTKTNNYTQFTQSFFNLLTHILPILKREATVERCCDWFAKFSSFMWKKQQQFTIDFINFLLGIINAKDKAVRFRVCQMLGSILIELPEDADFSEELYENLQTSLLYRCRDKIPLVRTHAVCALHRLQIGDNEDPVMQEYIRLLNQETSADVRKAVVKFIAIHRPTLSHVLNRIHDISPSVRRSVYEALKEKVPMNSLKIQQRINVMSTGLQDRDSSVVDACGKLLIESWLAEKDYNIFTLLNDLDVELFPNEVEIILQYILTNANDLIQNSENKTLKPPFQEKDINPVTIFYWRVLCDNIYKKSYDKQMNANELQSILDEYLPDTVELCSLISKFQNHPFICQELLQLCLYVDLSDEAGRENLTRLLCELIREISIDPLQLSGINHHYNNNHIQKNTNNNNILANLLKALRRIFRDDENAYIRLILEQLSDIRDPLEANETEDIRQRRTDLELKYQTIGERQQEISQKINLCVIAQDYAAAQSLKLESDSLLEEFESIEKELNSLSSFDSMTWIRLLSICSNLLQHLKIFNLKHPGISGLIDTIIIPAFAYVGQDSIVREYALYTLGVYCILDANISMKYLPMFLAAIYNDPAEEIKIQTLPIIIDLIMAFNNLITSKEKQNKKNDSENNNEEQQQNLPSTTTEDITEMLVQYLDTIQPMTCEEDPLTQLGTTAIEGLMKLLLYNRIPGNVEIIKKLLCLSFDPAYQVNTYLIQALTVFFPAYANSDCKLPLSRPDDFRCQSSHRELYISAFFPTIKEILSNEDDKYENVDINTVIKCFIFLLQNNNNNQIQEENNNENSLSITYLTSHEVLYEQCFHTILSEYRNNEIVKICIKTLEYIPLTSNNQLFIKSMKKLYDEIQKVIKIKDKLLLKSLEKIQNTLIALDQTPQQELTKDEMKQMNDSKKLNIQSLSNLSLDDKLETESLMSSRSNTSSKCDEDDSSSISSVPIVTKRQTRQRHSSSSNSNSNIELNSNESKSNRDNKSQTSSPNIISSDNSLSEPLLKIDSLFQDEIQTKESLPPIVVSRTSSPNISSSSNQQQLLLQDSSDLDISIRGRSSIIKSLSSDVINVSQMFGDIKEITDRQTEQINTVEENIQQAHENVIAGEENIRQASRYRSYGLTLGGTLLGLAVGGPVGLFLGAKIGIGMAGGAAAIGATGAAIGGATAAVVARHGVNADNVAPVNNHTNTTTATIATTTNNSNNNVNRITNTS